MTGVQTCALPIYPQFGSSNFFPQVNFSSLMWFFPHVISPPLFFPGYSTWDFPSNVFSLVLCNQFPLVSWIQTLKTPHDHFLVFCFPKIIKFGFTKEVYFICLWKFYKSTWTLPTPWGAQMCKNISYVLWKILPISSCLVSAQKSTKMEKLFK